MLGLRSLVVVPSLLLGCGSPAPTAQAVRPTDPTASTALNEAACTGTPERPEPLVVDLKAHQRANIETAMHDGVAVVAHDCKSLRLLPECKAEGSYGFIAVSAKEESVQLLDRSELRANLPASAGLLGAKLEASLGRGASFDIGMVMVGKRRTTVAALDRAKLTGSCEGATHFVRGAFVGAFATSLGTRAKVRTVAEIFGTGGALEEESQRAAANRDGDLAACSSVDPSQTVPPAKCSALLRLELVALGNAAPASSDPAPESERLACAPGFVLSKGKCTAEEAAKPHQCNPDNARECEVQCGLDHGGSCYSYGQAFVTGKGVPRDDVKAIALYNKACDLGVMNACQVLGFAYSAGHRVPKDEKRAIALSQRACEGGHALACTNLGHAYADGEGGLPRDPARALALYRRSCDGGASGGCKALGFELTKTDPKQAFSLFRRDMRRVRRRLHGSRRRVRRRNRRCRGHETGRRSLQGELR